MIARQPRESRIRTREFRFAIYLALLLGVAAWKYIPRPWKPTVTVVTSHYVIQSTATQEQTEQIGRVVELLYSAYSNRFAAVPSFQREHSKLKLELYKDRKEFRRTHPNIGWAEAYYREPICRAYYSAAEMNSCQWMLHEAVHQLNTEVAHFHLAQWLDEGLAEYFSTSRVYPNRLDVGRIDPNTYPVWWLDTMATTPNLQTNIANGSIIPLRAIISGKGGPSKNRQFNLYYLHWWTLTHFLFETPERRTSLIAVLQEGGTLEGFQRIIGPLERVEPEWHNHVQRIKAAVAGSDPQFLKTGELPGIDGGP